MSRIKFDVEHMKLMSLFETLTHAKVKDFIKNEESVLVIVYPGELGKAIGKKASNIRRMENTLKKKVKVIEYSTDLVQFIKNLIMPIRAKEIEVVDDLVTIHSSDSTSRGFLIGRAAVNLRNYESIVKRYFPIREIKVV